MIQCPSCDKRITVSTIRCMCGWEKRIEPKNKMKAKPQSMCGNCRHPLVGGWTQSPKGRVCDPCWRGYMTSGWPA